MAVQREDEDPQVSSSGNGADGGTVYHVRPRRREHVVGRRECVPSRRVEFGMLWGSYGKCLADGLVYESRCLGRKKKTELDI